MANPNGGLSLLHRDLLAFLDMTRYIRRNSPPPQFRGSKQQLGISNRAAPFIRICADITTFYSKSVGLSWNAIFMNLSEIGFGWRQVRIFTSNFSHEGYLNLLGDIVQPFASCSPQCRFFFTRYVVELGKDDGDTKIEELHKSFLHPYGNTHVHWSVRLRFSACSAAESFLHQKIIPSEGYWMSDIRNYDVLGEFGGERFCPSIEIRIRYERTKILTDLLSANSQFLLHTLGKTGDEWRFETNNNSENNLYKSTCESVYHLLWNAVGQDNGEPIPLVMPNLTGTGFKSM